MAVPVDHKKLAQLDIAPARVPALPARLRNKLLYFLLRWQAYEKALACLEALPTERYVSLQDMQADALDGLGQAAEAVALMQKRLAQRVSVPAKQRLVRFLLRSGAIAQAQAEAEALLAADENAGYVWSLLGDVQRAAGDGAGAEASYLRHRRLAPSSRLPLLGLAHIAHQSGDSVTAAAYAVQAYTVEEGQQPLHTGLLQRLADFFGVIGDGERQAEAQTELGQRFQAELEGLRAELRGEQPPARPDPEAHAPLPTPPPLPDLAAVPVSDGEREGLEQAARRLFGFDGLLPAQTEIMACVNRGENVLAILPTGAGKSLCYQLPAFFDDPAPGEPAVTLVISPLIALMKDQVDGLPGRLQSQAIAINSSLDGPGLEQATADIAAGKYRLVYAAPERLRQRPFLYALHRAGLARFVIDEAHCVSVWGHDFRPDYLHIAQARRDLGSPPILALTATAPVRVREDIGRQLFGTSPQQASETPQASETFRVIATDTFRPNLQFAAFACQDEDEKLRRLIELCAGLEGSGIVYARTRRRCEEIAGLLRGQGVEAVHYHAGIPNRDTVQDRFMQGAARVIVATIAFGMGVDKADIRFIIHYGLADSVESYYQEAGRAGRDGDTAHCVLLHSSADKATLTRNANRSAMPVELLRKLYAIVKGRAGSGPFAKLSLDELVRASGQDDTTARVGLSYLEQAGLLRRHYDPPRSFALTRHSQGEDDAFDAFAAGAGLALGQTSNRSFAEVCRAADVSPAECERQVFIWQANGHVTAAPVGRALLLELLPAPTDASTRIDGLLSRHEAIQRQRVTEIVRYARSGHCRHGHLASYLGGKPRQQCPVCDNCVEGLVQTDAAALPGEEEQMRLVLQALDGQGWGARNLIGLLRGEATASERARQSPQFGALQFRSEAAISRLIDGLLGAGHLESVQLSHGGSALGLTAQGQRLAREAVAA